MHTGSGFPSVVGFDLPGLQDGPGPSRVIVSALLDTTPGDDWMRVLDRLAWPALRLDHGVEQLRLVGQGIHFVGDIRDGRGLSAAVRELFDLVTAKVLSARMAALEKGGDGLYRNASNAIAIEATDARVRQGMLEGSNVNPILEITNLIEIQRAYESVTRMIENTNDLSRRAVERLGRA